MGGLRISVGATEVVLDDDSSLFMRRLVDGGGDAALANEAGIVTVSDPSCTCSTCNQRRGGKQRTPSIH